MYQSQRNIVKIALQQLNSPFHDVFSIILSRSDVYIKVNGTSIQLAVLLFFKIGSSSLAANALFTVGAVTESLSPMVTNLPYLFSFSFGNPP